MCPACFTTAAWLILGSTSAGGLLTAGIAKLRTAPSNPATGATQTHTCPSAAPEKS
jgi:hypothetical protein